MDRDFAERPAGVFRVRARSRDWFLSGVRLNGEDVDPERTPIHSDTAELVISSATVSPASRAACARPRLSLRRRAA
ncbi:MAG: hypothetical protein R2724_02070 [Bryobacterales bacterium]